MNLRRQLQSMLLPLSSRDPIHSHGAAALSANRRLLWLVLGSLVVLSFVSMATLTSEPALRARLQSVPAPIGAWAETAPPPPPPSPQPAPPPASPTQQEISKRRARVQAVAKSLARISQQTTQPRGIVLPLFDGIATLGISLILELREKGVELPIEIPHCGDLDEQLSSKLTAHDPRVRVYDACQEASTYRYSLDRTSHRRKLFCASLADCHAKFRGFDIKLVALLLSRFDELMMLDADTLFFQSPMCVWQSPKYEATGTLFFHDRVSCDHEFLAMPVERGDGKTVSHLQDYLSHFDPMPFRSLDAVPRAPATSPLGPWIGTQAPVALPFAPSGFLLQSHAWQRRAGHQADSSLMLWHKKKQPRATAILGAFIARGGIGRPPSYGDKELYFIACELAESSYAFSDFGTGSFGTDVRDPETTGKAVLCGHALHYMPDDTGARDPPVLYINSDRLTEYKPTDTLYRSRGRPASLFPGKIEDRQLAQECPFDLTVEKVTVREKELLARRQELYATAASWLPPPTKPPTTTVS